MSQNKTLGSLNLLSKNRRHQILEEWNETKQEYPRDKCVPELFEEQVERTPEAVAVEYEGEELSYRELNERANRLAHDLIGRGVGPEDVVGICVERSLEMVVGLLGVLKAGAAYLPLDPEYPQERLNFIIEDAQLKWVISTEALGGKLPETTTLISPTELPQTT